MINYLEEYRRNLQLTESLTLDSVLKYIPLPEVAKLVQECRKNPIKFIDSTELSNLSLSLPFAIIGLSGIRDLMEKTSDQTLSDSLTCDQSLELALQSFVVGGLLGQVGPTSVMELYLQKYKELVQIPHKANEARHAELRLFKKHAEDVAKKKWEEGSSLLHHKMVKHLINEYEEDGKFPFLNLPGDSDASPDKVLLRVVKQVAKDLKRPDLISGTKKIYPKG